MRHGKSFNHLGRTAPHRRDMLSNMASSLILHKKISTTVAKAKALRVYVEPLITKAKNDSTHSRRVVFSYLQNKESVKALFGEVADKVADRPGGYTRILKIGNRQGDNAEMCIMELVDFNEFMLAEKAKGKKEATGKTRRSRRGSGAGKTEVTATATEKTAKAKPAKEKKEAAPADEPVDAVLSDEVDAVAVETASEVESTNETEVNDNLAQNDEASEDNNTEENKEGEDKA